MNKVIFFGNGPLADAALSVLQAHADQIEIIFHARNKQDLETAAKLKREYPDAFGILASFGVIIKSDFLQLFEPIGILNVHPSLLPKYRGTSPIESAILAGDNDFSYSIMKLAKTMDAGPIYHQETFANLPLDKFEIYHTLATKATEWLVANLENLPNLTPTPQDNQAATFTKKLDKTMSFLHPETHSASEILRQIVAYQHFPKPKYDFFGKTCIILKAHTINITDALCDITSIEMHNSPLMLKCADHSFVVVDELQPEGKKPMDAVSFMNGYGKKIKN